MSNVQDVPVDSVFGALYFAVIMSATFYGVACMQM